MSIKIEGTIKTGDVGGSVIKISDSSDPDIEIAGHRLKIPEKYKNTEKQQAFIDGWIAGISAVKERS